MKILHFTPSYYPATYYGGPIFATHALCNALAALPETELRVLTTDTAGPKRTDRLQVTGNPTRFPAGYDVTYTRRLLLPDIAPELLARLWGMIGWADAVLLTGTYSSPTIPTLLACRLRDKPLVWSPHGALQASHEWMAARRPVLKRTWEMICRKLKPRRCVLHVTAESERTASRARLPEFETVVIPNAVEVPQHLVRRSWRPNGALRLLFLGRIDPIKRLDSLLRALASVEGATLDVYGRGDPAYVQSMQQLTSDLGLNARVRFHGHVDGDAKRDAFLNADLFVLPSDSENFGMVVAEALAHGMPAVVSHGAPWPELETRGCGRWVVNTPQSLAQAIMSVREADFEAMGARGRRWMQTDFGWMGVAIKFWDLCAQMHETTTIADLSALS